MTERIIQFGEGNFLRGFVDYFIDALNKQGLYDGKIVVIQPRAGGRAELLNEQDGEYNLYMRGIEKGTVKNEHILIKSISRGIDPYTHFEEYMSLADNPDLRFVFSNTTEAGIAFDESCTASDSPCTSFPGKLTQLLYRRFNSGLSGLVFLPCELIERNGEALKECVLKYAALWSLSDGFIKWIENENTFCDTLVDRIVTGFPEDEAASLNPNDRLLDTCEFFHLWVIGGDFENELPLQKAGFNVIWTDDVSPYKKRKVRILNGSHTSMVFAALLSGLDTVGECMEDKTVFNFLRTCLFDEILPTIGLTDENAEFAEAVLDRFRNPFIKHKLRSIALNSVSKFSVRVLPTVEEYREKNGVYPKALLMSLAFLIEFYKTNSPQDLPEVTEFMKSADISQILSNVGLWGKNLSDAAADVTAYIEKIKSLGARGAMEWIMS